jgi:hypothetical protein
MNYRTCQEAFDSGVHSRLNHPLHLGLYKLKESRGRIEDVAKEVCRIGDFIRKRTHLRYLTHYSRPEVQIYLKRVPLEISYRMGYEIIPAFMALEFDGVDRHKALSIAKSIELRMPKLLVEWECLRRSYSKKISNEYGRKLDFESYALDIANVALGVIDDSVLYLPSDIQTGVYEMLPVHELVSKK